MIPFAEWLPDQADLRNAGSIVAKNVLPHAMGFQSLPSITTYSDALTARCSGAFYARDSDDNVFTFAGDATTLSVIADGVWNDVSRTTPAYTTGSSDGWQFVKWDETVIATNYADAIQTKAISASGNFAALAGSPPKARHIAVARNFVILGDIDDSGAVSNRVQWSGINNPETWTPDATTQADYEDLRGGGGRIQRLFGGEYVTVFQENTTWRMDYAGSPLIWNFDETAPGVGLLASGMAAQDGDTIYFLSPKGFMSITNGASVRPIGSNKVDAFVLSDIDTNYLNRCSAAVDNKSQRVYFSYPGADSVDGLANKMVVYDVSLDRWGYSEQDTEVLFTAATSGYTLDGLDSVTTDLDSLDVSLDDVAWTGGRGQLAKIGSNHKMGFFTGSPMSAVVETAELQLTPDRRTLLSAVRPVVDGGSQTIQVGYRDLQTDAEVWTTARTPTAGGRANVRQNARYHRFRVNISGSWTHAIGVEPEASAAGWR